MPNPDFKVMPLFEYHNEIYVLIAT